MPEMDWLSPIGGDWMRAAAARQYNLRVSLPGMAKDQIMVAFVDGYVEVHGLARQEKTQEAPGVEYYEVEEIAAHHRIPLPADAALEEARVILTDGEALIEIPRRNG